MLKIEPRHLERVRALLSEHVPDCQAWAFGSRARGKAKPYSDLDLALLGPEPLNPRRLALLDDALRESDLPFKVDLVDLATASEDFRALVEETRVAL